MFYIAIALLIAFFLENLTMLLCAFFAAFVSLAATWLVIILFAVSSGLLLINPDIAYFVDRLTASNESNNLSVLVYIQGWEMIPYYFSRTYGWGIGFQQLGETFFTSPASTSINALIGMDLNLNDGSFIFSKLCSEFGYFGLIACVIYIFYFFRALIILRKISNALKSSQPGIILALSIFISYSMNLFIRESGYFTGSGFLFLSSILFLSKSNFFSTFGFRK
jgi:cell division protein FtsW (lipid II flippase)